jgi:hypothetical protein
MYVADRHARDISVHGFGRGEGVVADSSYTGIARVGARSSTSPPKPWNQ